MTHLLLLIYDYLNKRRWLTIVLLVALTVIGILLSLRIRYEENIAAFLPRTAENAKQATIYNALGDQGQITVIFRPAEDVQEETVMEAIDLFEEQAAECLPTNHHGLTLQTRADESDAMQAINYVSENIALYLTDEDYRRIDSLLANPDYIAQSMTSAHQTLSMPLPQTVTDFITADPLSLFSPVFKRLEALNPNSSFQIVDGYLFDSHGNGYVFLTSPYNAADTKRNGTLSDDLQTIIDNINSPKVTISAVGAPLISVTNARQLKKDSILSIGIAIVLIAIVLMRTMGRRRNILWMGLSVAAGWLFALAVIAIIKSEISIIVIGIGSVLVGIAVNYPLHYLEHLKNHPDRRETLREMIEPLSTGNITTVAAFACLIFVKAEAMRDLGLFGSLMLIGTIAFTLIFLPLIAKSGSRNNDKSIPQAPTNEQNSKFDIQKSKFTNIAFWVIVAATVVLAFFSTHIAFDSDLHNINFMTPQQHEDLALLTGEMGESTLTYVVTEDSTLNGALQHNDHLNIDGIASLMPSLQRQQKALAQWQQMTERYPNIVAEVQHEANKAGFSSTAFQPFYDRWQRHYTAHTPSLDNTVGLMAQNHILHADSMYYVINYLHGAVPNNIQPSDHVFYFTPSDVGSGLVNALNDDFNYILYVCSIVVFLFLWIALGRIELALLSFLPMAMGWIWILGIMAIFGIKFNIVNIILATFIFGQGDDYTIFITEGMLYENATGLKRLKEYRRSVIISAILMFVGIGTLIFAKHPAMHSLGEVAIIGMACVVIMACIIPPVIFRWLTTHDGNKRKVPITLKRIIITWLPIIVFAVFALIIATPLTILYMLLPGSREGKRNFYHTLVCKTMRIAMRLMPCVKFRLHNPYSETFDNPAIIVANHSSHLDLLCIMMLHPKIVILTKQWVWRNPLYALVLRYAEFLPAEGSHDESRKKLQNLVERGYSIMIFPEGTRTKDGNIARFHKGAFVLAKDLNLPILPIFIEGAYQVWPKSESLITEGTINITIGQRISDIDSHACRQLYINTIAPSETITPPDYYQYIYKGREIWYNRPHTKEVHP